MNKLVLLSIITTFSITGRLFSQETPNNKNDQFSYGWEIEFEAGDAIKENDFASFPDRSGEQDDIKVSKVYTNTKKYPFLTSKGVIEPEGNIEITSLPFFDIPKTFSTMKLVKRGINLSSIDEDPERVSHVRSIHLHMRFNKTIADQVNDQEFRSWVSRISDYIYIYRLKFKDPLFVMRFSVLQTRVHPDFLMVKGTVKLIPDNYDGSDYGIKNKDYQGQGGQYDLEFRGLMSDANTLEEITKDVTSMLKDPSKIKGLYDYQTLTYTPTQSLVDYYNQWLEKNGKEILEDNSIKKLNEYVQMRMYGKEDHAFWRGRKVVSNNRVLLPLNGFEFMPFVSPSQRAVFNQAKNNFFVGLHNFISKNNIDDLLAINKDAYNDTHRGFYDPFKKWVNDSQIYEIYSKGLFSKEEIPRANLEALYRDQNFIKFLIDRIHLSSARKILKNIPFSFISHLFQNNFLSADDAAKIVILTLPDELPKMRQIASEYNENFPPTKEIIPGNLTTFIKMFSKDHHNYWDEEDCQAVKLKLETLGITKTHQLISNLEKLNMAIENHNLSGKEKLRSFNEKTLEKLQKYFSDKRDDSLKFERFLSYVAERLWQGNEDREIFRNKLKVLGVDSFKKLKEAHLNLNSLVKEHNNSLTDKSQHIWGFKNSTISTLARIIDAIEYLGVL